MTLEALISQGYYEQNDLNCAEAVLHGSNQVYGLGLDSEALKLAAGFGGGMHIEGVCGALSGSIMVIGRLYTQQRQHVSPRVPELSRELLGAFQEEMGSIECKYLKERYHDEQTKCRTVVQAAARALDLIVFRECSGDRHGSEEARG